MLLNRNGNPRSELVWLAEQNGIPHAKTLTVPDLFAAILKTWIQTGKGDVQHRFQISGDAPNDETWDVLTALGQTEAIDATSDQSYRLSIAGGALLGLFMRRLECLQAQRARGVDLDQDVLVVLGGGRILDPKTDDIAAFCSKHGISVPAESVMPKTERQMVRFVARNYPGLPHIEPHGSDDEQATFESTLIDWMQGSPSRDVWKGERVLLISSQPYAGHQLGVLRRVLPWSCKVSLAADAATRTLPLKTFLDTLAKQLALELEAENST